MLWGVIYAFGPLSPSPTISQFFSLVHLLFFSSNCCRVNSIILEASKQALPVMIITIIVGRPIKTEYKNRPTCQHNIQEDEKKNGWPLD